VGQFCQRTITHFEMRIAKATYSPRRIGHVVLNNLKTSDQDPMMINDVCETCKYFLKICTEECGSKSHFNYDSQSEVFFKFFFSYP
jgi:hypothetical protein